MNRWAVGLLFFVLSVSFVAMFVVRSGGEAETESGRGQSDGLNAMEKLLSVDDVAAHPDRYRGEISVGGVVSHVSPKEKIAVLISEAEFAECGIVCPNVVLPVQWRGALPSVEDSVVVRGKVEKTERGYIFVASHKKIRERATADDG